MPLNGNYPTLAEYLCRCGYDTGGFVANLDYCSRETGLNRGFAHYEDYPIELGDILTRYTGLGSRLDLLTPASVINRVMKKYRGDAFDVTPRQGAREVRYDGEPIAFRVAFLAANAEPTVLRVFELQRGPLALRSS